MPDLFRVSKRSLASLLTFLIENDFQFHLCQMPLRPQLCMNTGVTAAISWRGYVPREWS